MDSSLRLTLVEWQLSCSAECVLMPMLCLQEQHAMCYSLQESLAAAEEEAQHLGTAQAGVRDLTQQLEALRGSFEAVQADLTSAHGRLAAFDDSCRHSLDKIEALSAALQEAQHAKVCSAQSRTSCLGQVVNNCILTFSDAVTCCSCRCCICCCCFYMLVLLLLLLLMHCNSSPKVNGHDQHLTTVLHNIYFNISF